MLFCVFGIIWIMDNQNKHFRHIMLFFILRKAKTWCKSVKRYAWYMTKMPRINMCTRSDLQDFIPKIFVSKMHYARAGSVEINNDKVKTLIGTNPRYTTREIAVFYILKSSVKNHLRQLDYVFRWGLMFGFRMNWVKFIWSNAFQSAIHSENGRKATHCWSKWWRAMKMNCLQQYRAQKIVKAVRRIPMNHFEDRS